jgi:ElaB/YqjD/DUF883 family membrane-anchored ribosome-binding protein
MFSPTAKEPMNRRERAHNAEAHRRNAKAVLEADGHDINSAVHEMGKDVREFIETAVDSAGEGISQAKEKMSQAKEKISDATDAVTDHIREKPISSAAIALGIGVFLGAFFRRG